jgi:hypothetical protein
MVEELRTGVVKSRGRFLEYTPRADTGKAMVSEACHATLGSVSSLLPGAYAC